MELKEFKELKVGDKVKIFDVPYSVWWHDSMNKYRGKIMTIREVDFDTPVPAVRMVEDNGGGVRGYGWWWTPSMIEKKIEEEKTVIIIRTDGKTVTAYRGKERGVAICSSEDEFDLYTGASLALDRLFGEDKKHHSYSFPMKGTLNVEFDDDKMSGSIKFDAPAAEASMEEKKIDIPVTYVRLTDSDVITSAKDTHKEQPKQFKPGDKVRVVSKRPESAGWSHKMDKWLGKTMTIKGAFTYDKDEAVYWMEEDTNDNIGGLFGDGWLWSTDWFKKIDDRPKNTITKVWKDLGEHANRAKDAFDDFCAIFTATDELDSKPEVKEVKRSAKPGEWIKVTEPIGDSAYAEGDIYQVTKVRTGFLGIEWAHVNKPYKNGNSVFMSADEYVVLEGYEPPKEETKPVDKEVKREARVGEWIKIVNPSFTEKCYSKGDILKVYKRSPKHNGVFCETEKKVNKYSGITNDKGNVIILDSEYVVLEGYEPPKPKVKEVKREAKPGEWIKIVDPMSTGDFYSKGDILKVEKRGEANARVKFKDCPTYDGCFAIYSDEYVVLENYQPEEN